MYVFIYIYLYIYISSVNITDMVNFRSPHLFALFLFIPNWLTHQIPGGSQSSSRIAGQHRYFREMVGRFQLSQVPLRAQLQFSCQFLVIHQKDASQTCGCLFNFVCRLWNMYLPWNLQDPWKRIGKALMGNSSSNHWFFHGRIVSFVECNHM